MMRLFTARASSKPAGAGCHRCSGWRQCGLELHPDKTRIVYCKDADRRGSHERHVFTFLGYTFRPRLAKNR